MLAAICNGVCGVGACCGVGVGAARGCALGARCFLALGGGVGGSSSSISGIISGGGCSMILGLFRLPGGRPRRLGACGTSSGSASGSTADVTSRTNGGCSGISCAGSSRRGGHLEAIEEAVTLHFSFIC